MQQFSNDSIDLGKIACFYLSDITSYLRENPDDSNAAQQQIDKDGNLEQAIMLIGGWSKTSYLTELNVFYPSNNRLARWGNSIRLMAPDMVTKRPVYYQDCLYVLGRQHIHIVDLKRKKTFYQMKHGENRALEDAANARRIFDSTED